MEYIRPFVQRELLEARMDELHHPAKIIAEHERDIAAKLTELITLCNEKLHA